MALQTPIGRRARSEVITIVSRRATPIAQHRTEAQRRLPYMATDRMEAHRPIVVVAVVVAAAREAQHPLADNH